MHSVLAVRRDTFATFVVPMIFVLLWSSGPIATKIGLVYVEPFTFLAYRFGILAIVLIPFLGVMRITALSRLDVMHAVIAGLLIQVAFLGAAFIAIKLGVSAGLSALITGLQPLMTSLIAAVILSERLTLGKGSGILVGFLGLSLFVLGQLHVDAVRIDLVLIHLAGLVAIAGGMVYQRRFAFHIGILPNTTIQYFVAAVVFVPAALLFERRGTVWSFEFIGALSWMVIVLSLGATSLLFLLIKRHQASNVSSLFYLMPPTAAVFAYLILGETLSLLAIAGLALAIVGVALMTGTPASQPDIKNFEGAEEP